VSLNLSLALSLTDTHSSASLSQCGIPYPSGIDESVYSATELARATLALLRSKPSLTRVVVKLTEGFSGKGNALLSYPPAREWSHLDEQIQLEAMLTALRTTLSFQAYGEVPPILSFTHSVSFIHSFRLVKDVGAL